MVEDHDENAEYRFMENGQLVENKYLPDPTQPQVEVKPKWQPKNL